MEEFISLPLAVPVKEDLLGTPQPCISRYVCGMTQEHLPLVGTSFVGWPKGWVVGLCTAWWQLRFGWHVFCSLPCRDGGRKEEGTKGWMGRGHRARMGWGLTALCPLPFPPSCLAFLGTQGWRTIWGAVGDQGSRTPCPSVQYRLPCPASAGWANANPAGSYVGGFLSLSP